MPVTISTQWEPPNPIFEFYVVLLLEMDPKPYKNQDFSYCFPIFPLRGAENRRVDLDEVRPFLLFAVMGLLLHDGHGTVQSIYALAVILVHHFVVSHFDLPDARLEIRDG